MALSKQNSWLNRFAVLCAVATLLLIGLGGLVTSHEAGMAVPDWPTTYGYNMFLFPPSYWIGGIFYEHSHRLFASLVGLLTAILAIWLWVSETRRWLRWLGVAAFVMVVIQGVLGGLRVTLMLDELGIFHAALAQLFLVLMSFIALATSKWWSRSATSETVSPVAKIERNALFLATILVFGQLILGAAMRHQHAGLAVPDFPLAYGKLWPPTDTAFLDRINRERVDVMDPNPITAFHIQLHMIHRIGAVMTLIATGWIAWRWRSRPVFRQSTAGLFALVCLQAILGAATVWSNKAADVATAHVMTGALILVSGALLIIVSFRDSKGRSSIPFRRGADEETNGEPVDLPAPCRSA